MPPERASSPVRKLFASERRLRAVVECVLEGNLGEITTDNADLPQAALIQLGCYAIFAGQISSWTESMVRDLPSPIEIIVPENEEWRTLLQNIHGDRLCDRPMESFSPHLIQLQDLREIIAQGPKQFELRRIDAELASRLGSELQPHGMQVMVDPVDFAQRSGGVCALDSEGIICAATNYAFTSKDIELAIATHANYRGMGLATLVAATWVLTCLEANITPHWHASNPVSKRLARRLGYVPSGVVEVSYLNP